MKKVTDETEQHFTSRIRELESKVVYLEQRQSEAVQLFKSSLDQAKGQSVIVSNMEPCRVLSMVISEGEDREEEKEEMIAAYPFP